MLLELVKYKKNNLNNRIELSLNISSIINKKSGITRDELSYKNLKNFIESKIAKEPSTLLVITRINYKFGGKKVNVQCKIYNDKKDVVKLESHKTLIKNGFNIEQKRLKRRILKEKHRKILKLEIKKPSQLK
mmetsp:Transcript_20416/g.50096  ORF Transcript_20416/g.50096 Transcript_20416/m.50096 type:complete len:132 (+) Transcript_20416:712-1107(+)